VFGVQRADREFADRHLIAGDDLSATQGAQAARLSQETSKPRWSDHVRPRAESSKRREVAVVRMQVGDEHRIGAQGGSGRRGASTSPEVRD
jgi:hypothetical protein